MPLPPPHKIVIIGAGFGGLRTALELLKRRARLGNTFVTLIDAHQEHVYTPLLYEVAMGCLESDEASAICALRSSASLPYAENPYLHRKDDRLRFVHGQVEGIDWEQRIVKIPSGESVAFNDIVLAVGGEIATFGIPGIREYAVCMKTLENAFAIRRRIASVLKDVREGRRHCLDVVVVGGGPNGCEGAGELARYLSRLARQGDIPSGCFSVTIVEAGAEILQMFSPRMRAMARRRLAELGIAVRTNVRVREVKSNSIVLPDGELLADVIVWAAGMKPRDAVKAWGFPTDERGFVLADATFAVQGKEHAWALGDCAFLRHPASGIRIPALAQAASKQASTLAENIARTLERKPTVNYIPPARWNTVVPLGGPWAVADLGFVHITGLIGYSLRKAADLLYFLSILPLRRALPFWWHGLRVFLQND